MNYIEKLAIIYDVVIKRQRLWGVRATVSKYQLGYLILVDDRLPEDALERTLMHEFLHIILGHLDERADEDEELKEIEVKRALQAMGY